MTASDRARCSVPVIMLASARRTGHALVKERQARRGGPAVVACVCLCLLSGCVSFGDDFPDFYLVNTCDGTIEAAARGFSGPFTLKAGETLKLGVNYENETITFELRVNGDAYDSVTGVSPLRILSCPPA